MFSKENHPNSKKFSDLVTCYVINLDSRPERWRRVEHFCKRRGIDPIRFSAHDRERGRLAFPGSPLAPSELGLWSSFNTVIQSDVETEWILVLEDDAFLLPRFRRHAVREVFRAGPEVLAIRMGWLGPFVWRDTTRLHTYLLRLPKRMARPIWHAVRRFVSRNSDEITRSIWGTHALLIRRDGVEQLIHSLGGALLALDDAFTNAERREPAVFARARRNRAWQWPDSSDIREDRSRRKGSGARVGLDETQSLDGARSDDKLADGSGQIEASLVGRGDEQ